MNRPEEIKARLDNISQIEGIIGALRAIAAGHQQEARRHLDAVRAHEATVAGALARALATGPAPAPGLRGGGRALLIVSGAAQGFSGDYSDQISKAALSGQITDLDLMVVGHRTLQTLSEEAPPDTIVWSADMAPHMAEIPTLASRTVDAAFSLVAQGSHDRIAILFADAEPQGQKLIRRTLVPFDFGRFAPDPGNQPRTTRARADLLAALAEEYVFAEVCEALMLGFASESAARAAAMARAQTNVRRISSDLARLFNQARQEQMTTEIIELASRDP
jgi:F-type H+-transporting ATPase subunit gamma